MRALVLGSGGQLGTEIVSELRRKGMSVVGLGRDELDITDEDAIHSCFTRHKPGWVINTAAYNYVDLAEKEAEKLAQSKVVQRQGGPAALVGGSGPQGNAVIVHSTIGVSHVCMIAVAG